MDVERLINEETFPYELNPEFEVVTNVKVVEFARDHLACGTVTDEMVEAAGRAAYAAHKQHVHGGDDWPDWEGLGTFGQATWKELTRPALEAAFGGTTE